MRQYQEVGCKSLLNRVSSPSMPFRWSINPYRGCLHSCKYCYARGTHQYLGLNADQDFENMIFAKTNAPEVLRQELSKPTWRREVIAIGTAVDPYQPAEGRYRLTRQILGLLLEFETPCTLVTKNTMIVRDLDLLTALAKGPGCQVHVSVTTMQTRLVRLLEPDTPLPTRRLEALQALAEAGVPTGVLVAPVLPGLTDTRANLEEVVRAAAQHGARFLHSGVLRLNDGAKEVYSRFLAEHFPALQPLYQRLYGQGAYAPVSYRRRVEGLVRRLSCHYGIPQSGPILSTTAPLLELGGKKETGPPPVVTRSRARGVRQLQWAW